MKKFNYDIDILKAMYRNQLALAAAIDELARWTEDVGSPKTSDTVKDILESMSSDNDLIDVSLSLMEG